MNRLEQILGVVVLTTSLIGCSTLPQQEPIYNDKQYMSIGSDAISSMIIYLHGYIPSKIDVDVEYKDGIIEYKTR